MESKFGALPIKHCSIESALCKGELFVALGRLNVELSLPILERLYILKVDELFKLRILQQMHLYCKNESLKPIGELFTKYEQAHSYEIRYRSNSRSTKAKLNITSKSFLCMGPKICSNLQSRLQTIQNTNIFFKRMKRNLLENYA